MQCCESFGPGDPKDGRSLARTVSAECCGIVEEGIQEQTLRDSQTQRGQIILSRSSVNPPNMHDLSTLCSLVPTSLVPSYCFLLSSLTLSPFSRSALASAGSATLSHFPSAGHAQSASFLSALHLFFFLFTYNKNLAPNGVVMLAVSLLAPHTQNSFLKEFTVQVKSGERPSYKCIVEASRVTGQ